MPDTASPELPTFTREEQIDLFDKCIATMMLNLISLDGIASICNEPDETIKGLAQAAADGTRASLKGLGAALDSMQYIMPESAVMRKVAANFKRMEQENDTPNKIIRQEGEEIK